MDRLAKVQSVVKQIRDMSDADVEAFLAKGESETPLMIIDDVPIESEDVTVQYRVAKQTRFEATAEQGVSV